LDKNEKLNIPCFRKPPGKKLFLKIGARNILIWDDKKIGGPISPNYFVNRIEKIIPSEGYTILFTDGKMKLVIEISEKNFRNFNFKSGDEISLYIKEESVDFFN
jgi:hypothetical protein